MKSAASQLDLFGLPASALPPLLDAQSDARGEPPRRRALSNAEADPDREAGFAGGSPLALPCHWLVVTTTRARTACGIVIANYRRVERLGEPVDGEMIRCTHDRYDGMVSCARCLEVV